MSQLDPFIIYTVKLAMDFQSTEKPVEQQDEKTMLAQQNTNPMVPETMARIMAIKTFSLKSGEKPPKLRRENILSLLYHADEQWIASTLELSDAIKSGQSHHYAVDLVHRQQRIFLDTCHILYKHLIDSQKKFSEPIWFAAQVLHRQCQVRHLESFTSTLKPLASDLWHSMEQLRRTIHRLIQKQHQHMSTGFLSMLFPTTQFYASAENRHLLQTIVPYLNTFEHHWSLFEKALYKCYVQAVFGQQGNAQQQKHLQCNSKQHNNNNNDTPLPPTLFSDELTQLLPLALDRAMDNQLLDIGTIQSLDPLAFVALPRLAILAGVTWLSHVTGWRTNTRKPPMWIQVHEETLNRIADAFEILEIEMLQTSSKEKHHAYVDLYRRLEDALVHGCSDHESDTVKAIYRDVCNVADSILSSHLAQPFTVVLCHLFRHVGLQYDIEFEEEEDAVPIEQTLLDLAI